MRVLITGATRGIGQALSQQMTDAGNDVTGTCRGAPPAKGTWLHLDATDPSPIAAAAATWGSAPLDLLVCNAGVLLDRTQQMADGYPPAMWAEVFAVNVTGVFLTIQAFLPALRRSPTAKIAIISSTMGSDARASGGYLIYRASKAAVLNLGRNLAADLKADHISVGIYHPGWVQTDMGGGAADITTDASARGLVARFAALSLATTGCFESYDGTPLAF